MIIGLSRFFSVFSICMRLLWIEIMGDNLLYALIWKKLAFYAHFDQRSYKKSGIFSMIMQTAVNR